MSITITEKAAAEVKKIVAEQLAGPDAPPEVFLRMSVKGGGCSGFQHKLDLDKEMNPKLDERFEQHGVAIVIDRRSLMYLNDVVVDSTTPQQTRLQHLEPQRQDHLRLRQLVLDVTISPRRLAWAK